MPAASVELAPEIRADAHRFAAPISHHDPYGAQHTPYPSHRGSHRAPPHSLAPVAMGAYTSSNTGQNLAQTVTMRGAPTLTGGLAILLAGVVAGGGFGIAMKANQDRAHAAAAAARREAEPVDVQAHPATLSATNAVAAATAAAAAGAPATMVAPTANVVPTFAQPTSPAVSGPLAAASEPAPTSTARGGVATPAKGKTMAGRWGVPARGAVTTRHVEPPHETEKAEKAAPAEKPEPAPKAGGIRTVRIQAPAAEPAEKPEKAEKAEKPAKAEKAEKAEKPAKKGGAKSSDDLLEEAIKNTANVL